MHVHRWVPGHGYIAFLKLLARKAIDPYSWSCTIHLASENQVCNEGAVCLCICWRGHDCCHLVRGTICGNRWKRNGVFLQILEICECHVYGKRSESPCAKLSEVTHLGIRQVLGKGARVRKGLGKRLQGMLRLIAVIQKKDRFGLGYKPDRRERQRSIDEKRQNRIVSFL